MLDNSFERLKRFNLAEIYDPTSSGSSATVGMSETLASSEGLVDAEESGLPAAMQDDTL